MIRAKTRSKLPPMTRSELVARIAAENPHLHREEAARIIDTILREIADCLRRGNRVELRGFGTFAIKDRAPRIAYDPGRRRPVRVGRKRLLHFKSSRILNQRLDTALK